MHIISREHKRNPSMQQNQAEKSTQQREMCYGLSKQDSVGKKKAQINNTVVWEVEDSYQDLGGEWGSN